MKRASFVLSSGLALAACSSEEPSKPAGSGGGSSGSSANGGTSGSSGAGRSGSGAGGSAGSTNTGGAAGNGTGGSGGAGSSAGGSSGAAAGAGGAGISGAAGTAGTQNAAGNGGGGAGGTAGSAAGSAGLGGGAGGNPTGTPVVYVGGYSMGGGTYPFAIYDLDKESGALTARSGSVNAGPNPTCIAVSPSKRFLYVANEADNATGGLTALAIGPGGELTPLNHQTGSDGGFAYVAVDPTGKFAFGASYNGGSVSVFPLADDGTLGAQVSNSDFGADAQAHAVGFSLNGQHALVPCKGNDTVEQLLVSSNGMLSANTPPEVGTPAGAGPRHIAVHPSGALAFVMNELGNSVTPYALSSSGTLSAGTTVSSLPANFNGQNSGAHVELSPDGRFVYGSNRGHDSIVVFSADQATGALTLVEHEESRGDVPRDFDIDPQGDVLVVANQNSDNLAVFSIGADGALTPLGAAVNSPPDLAAVQIVYVD